MTQAPRRTNLARALRRNQVQAETVLWRCLRNRALAEFKFRRQHPVGPYVTDFACTSCRIVVEVDGPSHAKSERADEKRSKYLEDEGWLVLRFWNTEIYEYLDAVRDAIYQACVERNGRG